MNHSCKRGLGLLLVCLAVASVKAQMSYTDHLTQKVQGKGTVVILQDAEIADIINNVQKSSSHSQEPARSAAGGAETGGGSSAGPAGKEDEQRPTFPLRHQRVRAVGYRIQIFTGSNSHADKVKAYKIGEKCHKAFPMLSVYPRYYNPRWTCRVGDFKTREEASAYAQKIRAAHISGEVRIVKCEVLLQVPVE